MLQSSSFHGSSGLLLILILSSSCSNYFKHYFHRDDLIEHYKPDLIAPDEKSASHFTENVELEEISLMENGLIKMGYSFFEKGDFDVIK